MPLCRSVRKHRAPKGALRHCRRSSPAPRSSTVRKHRAPKGALRPPQGRFLRRDLGRVRKHRAPKGALRLEGAVRDGAVRSCVRKHRAPKGALRHTSSRAHPSDFLAGQKAPSAKRCIKTSAFPSTRRTGPRQKAPSAKRCIKTIAPDSAGGPHASVSESTERQKVH